MIENEYQGQWNPLNYIFKSRNYLPWNKCLLEFENNLVEFRRSVKFKSPCLKFREKPKTDLPSIKQSKIACILYNIFYIIYVYKPKIIQGYYRKLKTSYLQRILQTRTRRKKRDDQERIFS